MFKNYNFIGILLFCQVYRLKIITQKKTKTIKNQNQKSKKHHTKWTESSLKRRDRWHDDFVIKEEH